MKFTLLIAFLISASLASLEIRIERSILKLSDDIYQKTCNALVGDKIEKRHFFTKALDIPSDFHKCKGDTLQNPFANLADERGIIIENSTYLFLSHKKLEASAIFPENNEINIAGEIFIPKWYIGIKETKEIQDNGVGKAYPDNDDLKEIGKINDDLRRNYQNNNLVAYFEKYEDFPGQDTNNYLSSYSQLSSGYLYYLLPDKDVMPLYLENDMEAVCNGRYIYNEIYLARRKALYGIYYGSKGSECVMAAESAKQEGRKERRRKLHKHYIK
jgi:hypothetical protein